MVELQRHVGGAGPQHGEQRHDRVEGARERETHGRLRSDAPSDEHAGHRAAAVTELRERHGRSPGDESDPLRVQVGRPVEPVDHGVRADVGARGELRLRSESAQCADRSGGAGQVVEHAQVVVEEAAGVRAVVVAVLQLDGEPLAGGDDPGERVVRRVVGLHRGDPVPGVHLGERVHVQEVLEHEEVVEQVPVPGGPLDLAEPQVLVLHGLDPGRLYGREVLPDGVRGPCPRPHRHGVEEHADDVGEAFALPPGHGHAEHGVGTARVRAQQEAERAGEDGVQGDPVGPGRRPQEVGPLGGQGVHEGARQLLGQGRLRPGEEGGSGESGQVFRPEALRHRGVPGVQGTGVVLEARCRRDRVGRLARQDCVVGAEQVAEQDLPGPAVPQEQVVAQQQAVLPAGQPDDGHPDQGRLARVESGVTVPGAQGFDVRLRRRLDRTDVHAAAGSEELDGVPVVVGGEAGTDDGVPRDDVRHRLGQRVGVQRPVEGEVALRDVVPGRAGHLCLEEQAALERGDRSRAFGRRGDLREAVQGVAPVLGDRVGDAVGEGEDGAQASGVVGPRVDLDGVRAVLVRAGEVQRLGLAAPAEVVEQHLRTDRQQGGSLRVEVAELAVGDVSGLVGPAFRDLACGCQGVGVGGEPQGGDGGEPADGAGVVVVVQRGDPAVPFQFDGEVGGRGLDVCQGGPERAAEQFGRADPEGGGRGARQPVAHLGRDHDRGLTDPADRGQQPGRPECGHPVVQVVGDLRGADGQGFGVLGVGRGRRGEGPAAQKGVQVVEQNQPGHGVDGEVVHGDHQGAARLQPGERDDVARLRVQAAGRVVRDGRRVRAVRPDDGDLTGGLGAQRPHAVLHAEPQPECRVRRDDCPRRAAGLREPGALGHLDGPGLGEPDQGAAQFALAQHDRRRCQRPVLPGRGGGRGRDGPRCARGEVLGERARCPVEEHVPRSDRQAQRPGPVDHGDGDDAVAAGHEEVGVSVDGDVAGQRPGEDVDEDGERGVVRPHRCALARGTLGERLAVQLSVDRQRQGLGLDHTARHHVHGQLPGQAVREVVGHPAHDVRDQVVLAVGHRDGRVDDAVELPDRGLHLAELDAEPLELHLVVGAAHELQLPAEGAAGEITGVVHAGSVGREGVRDEPAGGEPGPAQVAE